MTLDQFHTLRSDMDLNMPGRLFKTLMSAQNNNNIILVAFLCRSLTCKPSISPIIFDAHHHDGGGARGPPATVVAVDTRR